MRWGVKSSVNNGRSVSHNSGFRFRPATSVSIAKDEYTVVGDNFVRAFAEAIACKMQQSGSGRGPSRGERTLPWRGSDGEVFAYLNRTPVIAIREIRLHPMVNTFGLERSRCTPWSSAPAARAAALYKRRCRTERGKRRELYRGRLNA